MPLLFTMEVWWHGFQASPQQLLVFLVVILLLLFGYNSYSGFREHARWGEIAIDSIDELGVGLVTAAVVLAILGRITSAMPVEIILGKVIVEAGAVAMGISVGRSQLGSNGGDPSDEDAGSRSTTPDRAASDSSSSLSFDQMVIGSFGGLAYAANVAPTEEVLMIASESSLLRLVLLALFSVGLAAMVLHYSEFQGSRRFARAETPFEMAASILATYAVALATSAIVLWFFGRFEQAGSP